MLSLMLRTESNAMSQCSVASCQASSHAPTIGQLHAHGIGLSWRIIRTLLSRLPDNHRYGLQMCYTQDNPSKGSLPVSCVRTVLFAGTLLTTRLQLVQWAKTLDE